MEDRKLVVTNENGNEIEITVLDIVSTNYNGIDKEYIIYKIGNKEEVIISILDEKEESYSIRTIESMDEYNFIQNAILNSIEGEEL